MTKQQQETEDDLAKAEPALQAAHAALNTLNRVKKCFFFYYYFCLTVFFVVLKKVARFCGFCFQLNLTELRTFPNPPAIVTNVSAAVLVLMAPQGRIPKDRSWKASKMIMSKVMVYRSV